MADGPVAKGEDGCNTVTSKAAMRRRSPAAVARAARPDPPRRGATPRARPRSRPRTHRPTPRIQPRPVHREMRRAAGTRSRSVHRADAEDLDPARKEPTARTAAEAPP